MRTALQQNIYICNEMELTNSVYIFLCFLLDKILVHASTATKRPE
jgi:hypothetical protein